MQEGGTGGHFPITHPLIILFLNFTRLFHHFSPNHKMSHFPLSPLTKSNAAYSPMPR